MPLFLYDWYPDCSTTMRCYFVMEIRLIFIIKACDRMPHGRFLEYDHGFYRSKIQSSQSNPYIGHNLINIPSCFKKKNIFFVQPIIIDQIQNWSYIFIPFANILKSCEAGGSALGIRAR
jgi:hypothetical protein